MTEKYSLFIKKLTVVLSALLLPVCVFSQTKVLSTGHASISMSIKQEKERANIWISNIHPNNTYEVIYTVEYEFQCGGTKSKSGKEKVKEGQEVYSFPIYIGDCDASKGETNTIKSARLTAFQASEIQKPQLEAKSNGSDTKESNNGTSINKSESVIQSDANTEAKSTTENQNRHTTLKEQQEAQEKAQQQANYEKAMAYEEQRQQSIKKSNETMGAITNVVTDHIMQKAEEKRIRNEEEGERLQEEYERKEQALQKSVAIQQKIDNRRNAIAEFPSKDIPLGSTEKAATIYYFIYAYDNTLSNENGATVYVSNVFEIARYNDGTRAYTTTVKNETDELTPYTEVLHGYYYTQQQAEELRQSLIAKLTNNGVTISEVNYKGKPAAMPVTNTNTQDNSTKYGKTINLNNDQKLAPAEIKTASELPKGEQRKENSKYGKTIKID